MGKEIRKKNKREEMTECRANKHKEKIRQGKASPPEHSRDRGTTVPLL